MSKWPTAKLGNILTLRRDRIELSPGKTYKRITVKLGGLGVVLRDEVDGSAIKSEVQFIARAGQFVASKIDARNGSFGLVPSHLEGSVVSGNFLTFDCNGEKLLPKFIEYYASRRIFWEECARISEGTTNRVPVRIEQFLELPIDLPPLAEQRRVVARIEEVAAQVREARILRVQSAEEADALLTTARRATMSQNGSKCVALADACETIIDNLHSNPRLSETGIPCIRSPDVGYGTLSLDGAQRTDEEEFKRRTVRGEPKADDIVLVREGGGTGKCAVVQRGQRFSLGQRVMMLRPNTERILSRFFLHQLLSPQIQEDQIASFSKGSASPHLNIGALRKFNLVLPPLTEQRRIVAELDALQAEVDALKRLQAETAAEVDALLPAVLDKAFKGEL
jgi:type I restriction enzyme S subunit